MKRRVLNQEKVIAASLKLADSKGLHTLSLKELADALNIKPPSLYNHIQNQADLQHKLIKEILSLLKDALLERLIGKDGHELFQEIIHIYLDLCRQHPCAVDVLRLSTLDKKYPKEIRGLSQEVLDILQKVFQREMKKDPESKRIDEAKLFHGIRILRAQAQGFAMIASGKGFTLDLEINKTIELFARVFQKEFF